MNDAEIIIAIAESLGWSALHVESNKDPDENPYRGYLAGRHPSDKTRIGNKDTWWIFADRVPDYLNDLNACAKFEVVLDENGLWSAYVSHLKDICGEPQTHVYCRDSHIRATARQRCIAYLKTFNLWKD